MLFFHPNLSAATRCIMQWMQSKLLAHILIGLSGETLPRFLEPRITLQWPSQQSKLICNKTFSFHTKLCPVEGHITNNMQTTPLGSWTQDLLLVVLGTNQLRDISYSMSRHSQSKDWRDWHSSTPVTYSCHTVWWTVLRKQSWLLIC